MGYGLYKIEYFKPDGSTVGCATLYAVDSFAAECQFRTQHPDVTILNVIYDAFKVTSSDVYTLTGGFK